MAEVQINTIFQLKRGLAEAWIRNNPILRAGEPGFELDEKGLKIGDGNTAWKDLPYITKGAIVTEAEIIEIVQQYLIEHPVTIETDANLAEKGKAADAAAVREKCLMIDDSYEIIFCAGDADPSDDK